MLSKRHEAAISLQIKQDDKFFTRIMSKETSMANSSCRIYYGGASGAVPFMWESTPGTPKHNFADNSVPPLTPPPSYYSTSKSKSTYKRSAKQNPLSFIFSKLISQNSKKSHVLPSSSMSSTSTSPFLSPSNMKNSKSRNQPFFLCLTSPIHIIDDEEDDGNYNEHRIKPPAPTLCYG